MSTQLKFIWNISANNVATLPSQQNQVGAKLKFKNQSIKKMDTDILQMLKAILSEAGIQSYEPEVLTHLSDYIDGFIGEIMEKSKDYMKHASRTTLDVADVKLALDEKRKAENKCRPAFNARNLLFFGFFCDFFLLGVD